jgi:membrane protease YdiL (CAAX protease family)
MTMNHTHKIKAIVEVSSVFVLTFLIVWVMQVPSLLEWKGHLSERFYLEYAVMIIIPLLFLAVTRRSLTEYGITLARLPYSIKVAAVWFIPAVMICTGLTFLEWEQWEGAITLAVIEVFLLFIVTWVLESKITATVIGIFSILLIPLVSLPLLGIVAGKLVSDFVFYFVFVGLGEEILFRGYTQSRLNEAFGRPYTLFGVNWGWGLIIASIIFGIMHVLNPFNPFIHRFGVSLPWGLWTFFLGLILGTIRERTGSIVAPAIVHGVINFL